MNTASLHPTSYDLDCFSVHSLPVARAAELQKHLSLCGDCAGYLERLEAERAALHQRLPPRLFVQSVVERATRQPTASWLDTGRAFLAQTFALPTVRLALAGAALAATVLAIVLTRTAVSPPPYRAMGSLPVTAHLRHAGQVRQIDASVTPITTGDAVRFVVEAPRDGYLAVFFLDELGAVSWFVPEQSSGAPLAVNAGEVTIPGSAVFDGQPTATRAFVIFQEQPFSPSQEAQRLQESWQRASPRVFGNSDWIPPATTRWSALFEKPGHDHS